MTETLLRELGALDPGTRQELATHGFNPERFSGLATRLAAGPEVNRVGGNVAPLAEQSVRSLPDRASPAGRALTEKGLEALRTGACALLVLAGGMATRMGGVVKSLVPACDGLSFLDIRLLEMDAMRATAGVAPPLWLMTSYATDARIREALGERLDGSQVAAFRQGCFPRLTEDGHVFLSDAEQTASLYAPGHGDVPDCLRQSGLLDGFIERGGRTVMVANVDNLGATIDPLVVGWHLEHKGDVSVEVVEKVGSDRGGIPVSHNGRGVVLEEFRLPTGFNANAVRVFNSNTFHFNAKALKALDFDWTYFVVEKTVGTRKAIQLERLIGEVTSHLRTEFVKVPRTGVESRFLPVKDPSELTRREGEIRAVLKSRGILQ